MNAREKKFICQKSSFAKQNATAYPNSSGPRPLPPLLVCGPGQCGSIYSDVHSSPSPKPRGQGVLAGTAWTRATLTPAAGLSLFIYAESFLSVQHNVQGARASLVYDKKTDERPDPAEAPKGRAKTYSPSH